MPRTQVRPDQISDELTAADFASANRDGPAATPSLRTLGTGANQAAPGDHTHNYQIHDAALDALLAQGPGLVIRTATGFTSRTLSGTPNQIAITNPDGVAGDPNIALPTHVTLAGNLTCQQVILGLTTGSILVVGAGGATVQDSKLVYDLDNHKFTHGQTVAASVGEVGLDIQATTNQNSLNLRDATGTVRTLFDNNCFGIIDLPTFILALGGPATVGANKTNERLIPRAGKIVKAFIRAKTGPVGSDLIVDLNLNGTSLWSGTPANRLRIVAGQLGGSQVNFDTLNVSEGDSLTIDIDQVGSVTPGQDITVHLLLLLRNQ